MRLRQVSPSLKSLQVHTQLSPRLSIRRRVWSVTARHLPHSLHCAQWRYLRFPLPASLACRTVSPHSQAAASPRTPRLTQREHRVHCSHTSRSTAPSATGSDRNRLATAPPVLHSIAARRSCGTSGGASWRADAAAAPFARCSYRHWRRWRATSCRAA